MTRKTRAAWLLGGVLLVTTAWSAEAQVVPVAARSKAAAPSDAAKSAFRKALYEVQNVAGSRGRLQLESALTASPQFGLARVYQAVLEPGVPAAERESRIAEQLGAMGSGSPVELLLATYWRETAAGRGPAAAPIIRAAAELAPDDPEVNYIYSGTQRAGKTPAEQVTMLRQFLERFPNHAAAYNQLAYTLWRVGDREGSLKAVQKYAEVAPEHPNSHDSYADILLLLDRGAEAVPHVQRIKQLDPTWPFADAKLGAISLTAGDVPAARSHFSAALTSAATPADRVEARYWLAATHVYQKNARAALQELNAAAAEAKAGDLPGLEVNSHAQAAVLEALMGNRRNVAAHLEAAQAAARNDNQKANHLAHSALALSRLGQRAEARAAATQFGPLSDDDEFARASIDAILALDARDYAAAEAAIARMDPVSALTKGLRAELMLRTGKKAEGEALRKQVLAGSVKQEGNPGVDFPVLIGRMRLMSM